MCYKPHICKRNTDKFESKVNSISLDEHSVHKKKLPSITPAAGIQQQSCRWNASSHIVSSEIYVAIYFLCRDWRHEISEMCRCWIQPARCRGSLNTRLVFVTFILWFLWEIRLCQLCSSSSCHVAWKFSFLQKNITKKWAKRKYNSNIGAHINIFQCFEDIC